jgi:O-acetyl-ADP-ribose deacetylase (regulator of RNase III)
MNIIQKKGDLLAVPAGHIVHGCNAQGVMGSGVALAIRQKYPGAYDSYRARYFTIGLVLGEAYPWVVTGKLVIWNAITQEGFGPGIRQVSYDAIQTCFENINTKIKDDQHTDVPKEFHIPMIGAGLGGGNWEIIKTIIEQTVTYPTTVWIL